MLTLPCVYRRVLRVLILVLIGAATLLFQPNATTGAPLDSPRPLSSDPVREAIVFVSRQIPPDGSYYWDVPNDMPGAGAYSNYRYAAPGKLILRQANGALRVLVDGANPTAASLRLIDVNAPAVSYDGRWIAFSGLRDGDYSDYLGPWAYPGAWRIYLIRADGRGLRQLTFSDLDDLDLSQFGDQAARQLEGYDDSDRQDRFRPLVAKPSLRDKQHGNDL